MELYAKIASFAQTWGLLYFTGGFMLALIHALRPSAGKKFDEAAQIPLRED